MKTATKEWIDKAEGDFRTSCRELRVPKEAKQTPQRITLENREGGQFVFYREGEE